MEIFVTNMQSLEEIIRTAKLGDNNKGNVLIVENPEAIVTIDYGCLGERSIKVKRNKDKSIKQWILGEIYIDDIIKYIHEQ